MSSRRLAQHLTGLGVERGVRRQRAVALVDVGRLGLKVGIVRRLVSGIRTLRCVQ
jgi:hypothetical protein